MTSGMEGPILQRGSWEVRPARRKALLRDCGKPLDEGGVMLFDDAAIAARSVEIASAEQARVPRVNEGREANCAVLDEYRVLCDSFTAAARRLGREPDSSLVIRRGVLTGLRRFFVGPKRASVQTVVCPCWPIAGTDYVLLDVGELVQVGRVDTPTRYSVATEAHLTVPPRPGLAALEDRMLSCLAAAAPAPREYRPGNDCDAILALYGY